ncbi:hypothetical protein [Baaleninema simplex]|nr:hypothetical protein [Baaleninema simplex]
MPIASLNTGDRVFGIDLDRRGGGSWGTSCVRAIAIEPTIVLWLWLV